MPTKKPSMSKEKLAAMIIFSDLFQLAFLLIPAGTLYWPEAWLTVIIFSIYAISTTLYLNKHDPDLLKKRTSYNMPTRGWDKLFIISSAALLIPLYIIPGLEAVRFGRSSVPLVIKAIGFAGFASSLIIIFLVMKENAYLFRTVTVQKGQKVVTTGPYGYIRHPMYAGFMITFAFLPLALGSYYALIPGLLIDLLLIIRTHFEDKELHKELKGYKAYAKKTKYKLLTGVW